MAAAEARVPTAAAQRYLTQLCKHFGHRLAVTLAEQHGRIAFPDGICELEANGDAGTLVLRVSAGDDASLARLEEVVARHLERFAFRETLAISWKPSASPAGSSRGFSHAAAASPANVK